MARESTGVIDKILQKHYDSSADYNEKQIQHVRNLEGKDVSIRILSFLFDSIFMFWPSLIFVISLLLLTSPANIGVGIINNSWDLTIVYILSILFFNTFSALYFVGQTFGMRYYQLKIVKKDNCEASSALLAVRELCGVSIPWALIMLSYNFTNFSIFVATFLLFIFINLLFITMDRLHRSIIDVVLGTKLVMLPFEDDDMMEQKEIVPAVSQEKEPVVKAETVNKPKKADSEESITVREPEAEKEEIKAVQEKEAQLKTEKEPLVEKEIKPEDEKAEPVIKKAKPVKKKKETVQKEPVKEKPAVKKEAVKKPEASDADLPKSKTDEKEPKKEKSVTEIISEAVSVVDQALEPKKEVFSIKIEKPVKKKTEVNEAISAVSPKDDKEETSKVDEPIKHETELQPSVEKKKSKANKNQKKKKQSNQKTVAKKNTVNVKKIKPVKKNGKGL